MDSHAAPQSLTHDEKNAAEAAFSGRPFNPKWSAKARLVYDGIVKVLPVYSETAAVPTSPPSEVLDPQMAMAEPAAPLEPPQTPSPADGDNNAQAMPARIPFQRALETGALIDVTETAKELGFSFPVTVTKPLWEVGIAPTHIVTQEEQSSRLRDVLMAFRLRLATQPIVSPLIDFPALLSFPPSAAPQPIPLFALIQPDEHNRTMATLLLPNEVSATIIPMN